MDQRTKNRMKEHTLVSTDRVSTQVFGCEGLTMKLWECVDPNCTWKGWLQT